jgi:hypothetical protein
MEVFLVGFDPVGRYLTLSGLEVQLPGAYELVELPLKRIFYVGVPRRCFRRLRPEVANGIRSSLTKIRPWRSGPAGP